MAPKRMRYFSDLHRTDLVDRTRMTGENYTVSNKPASTTVFKDFSRGAYRASPEMDGAYDADFEKKPRPESSAFMRMIGLGGPRAPEQKGIFYEGDMSLSRHRTVGLVNELIDSHIQEDPNATIAAGASVGRIGRKLTVEEQQAKLEDLQRALLEEAAVLDKMKFYYQDHPLCCPTWCIGDKDQSCMGGCIKFHPCCACDEYSDHYMQGRRQKGSGWHRDQRGMGM